MARSDTRAVWVSVVGLICQMRHHISRDALNASSVYRNIGALTIAQGTLASNNLLGVLSASWRLQRLSADSWHT